MTVFCREIPSQMSNIQKIRKKEIRIFSKEKGKKDMYRVRLRAISRSNKFVNNDKSYKGNKYESIHLINVFWHLLVRYSVISGSQNVGLLAAWSEITINNINNNII